jgi:hypothetical protein
VPASTDSFGHPVEESEKSSFKTVVQASGLTVGEALDACDVKAGDGEGAACSALPFEHAAVARNITTATTVVGF